ncbi:MAG TPA: L,D-transpeptidase family protein [Steroidobacteraceae bacterium]|nr:L,D-transpeptidase family protein [Steroidobacteraceae bacterium]
MRKLLFSLLAAVPLLAVASPQGDESLGSAAGQAVQLPVADHVVVLKSERRMLLMKGGEVLRSYRISLGLMPTGPKEHNGDYRTPEGRYRLGKRNAHSDYFLSVQVTYPNEDDVRRARRDHENPGGAIMVHGQPNVPRHSPDYYSSQDWTDGCIALSDSDMLEFWLLTQSGIPIEIMA